MTSDATPPVIIVQSCESRQDFSQTHVTIIVTMSKSGAITLHTVDPRFPNFPDETLKPGSMNYDSIIKMVDGIAPGQSKSMPHFIGRVDMNADGSLEYRGTELTGGVQTARPGDENYQRILALVGPLKPGGWAMVKETPIDHCKEQ